MSNNQINEDTKSDLLDRVNSLVTIVADTDRRVKYAASLLESLQRYVSALEVEEKPSLFVGSKPKKTFAVGDKARMGDGVLLPLGSRVENNYAAYWEKTGEGEWTSGNGTVASTIEVRVPGRKILRVGYDEPKRELELGDILFTKEDFEAVPEGHVVVEIASPENRHIKDGKRACRLHFNLFVDDPDYFTGRVDEGRFYYLYGGKPVPSADTELPLREAFDAWGANAVVELVRYPGVALTLSPDGATHFAYGKGIEAHWHDGAPVRLVTVLDDGKVIPGKAEKPKAAFAPGDVVSIHGGPFGGMKGCVLRVDLDLDNPYLVRAEGTTGYGRYEADDLSFSHRVYVLNTIPGDRIRNLWTEEVHTVTSASDYRYAPDYEFLMPKRVPKVGDVIDLKAARKLPVGSRVSVPGGDAIYWEKSSGRQWACVSRLGEVTGRAGDASVFKPDGRRQLLRYGHGDQ